MEQQRKSSKLILLPVVMLSLAAIACAQDCMGSTFSVEGYVVNIQNTPIPGASIRVWNNGSFERPAFEYQVTSDEDGYFESESAFSYACTVFQVEVSAAGFETINLSYYPPGSEFTDESVLPPQITVQLSPVSP